MDDARGAGFGREDSGLSNEELALADVLTGVPMAADYPSLNLGQSVMVYCYQLASLMQQTAPAAAAADHHQLQALRTRTLALLSRLGVEDDAKLADWLSQRLGLLQQRDTAMLHRLLHDIEKTFQNKTLSYFYLWMCMLFYELVFRRSGCFSHGSGKIRKPAEMGQIEKFIDLRRQIL